MVKSMYDEDFVFYHENSGELKGHLDIQNYLHGGKGVVTLLSPSGKHHTYSFRYPLEQDKFPEGTMFVYSLMREHVWMYVGMLQSNGRFRRTQFSKFNEDSPIVKGAKFISRMMREDFDHPMRLYHEGVCSICGRRLTSPKSIRQGIGPKCLRYLLRDDNLL